MQKKEKGQGVIFFILITTCILLVAIIAIELGRLVYARGEVAKCADAAALAAASRINVPVYRDSGQIIFMPDVYAYAQDYASRNSSYLSGRSIPVTVTNIIVDESSQIVGVTLSADLSPLLPSLLSNSALVSITGYSQARLGGQ